MLAQFADEVEHNDEIQLQHADGKHRYPVDHFVEFERKQYTWSLVKQGAYRYPCNCRHGESRSLKRGDHAFRKRTDRQDPSRSTG